MADDIRTQAATYIDGEHRRVHDEPGGTAADAAATGADPHSFPLTS